MQGKKVQMLFCFQPIWSFSARKKANQHKDIFSLRDQRKKKMLLDSLQPQYWKTSEFVGHVV